MAYVFLTACRNERNILAEFVDEFAIAVQDAGIGGQTTLVVVDDLSSDDSAAYLEGLTTDGFEIRVLRAPTNFGNQGAMFWGLQQVDVSDDDVLVTFDCDGEDDVAQLSSILARGQSDPRKFVLIERGRRSESLLFRAMFAVYKLMFRWLTGKPVIPNNFMLIPGHTVPAIRLAPLCAAHFAYGILKLGLPYVAEVRARRPRYGGRSSQSIYALVTHGMVGLMVFYEVVVAKLFMLVLWFGALASLIAVVGLLLPVLAGIGEVVPGAALAWALTGAATAAAAAVSLLLSAGLVLLLKVLQYRLTVDAATSPPKP